MSKNTIPEEIKPPEGIKIVFFDLDETLTYKDTDLLWALWRSRKSPRGWIDLFGMIKINRLYYSHTLTAEQYGAYHLKRAGSMPLSRYRKMAAAFAQDTAKGSVYPSMVDLIEENRSRGIRNVLITAQDEILGKAFSDILNLDACLASSYLCKEDEIVGMKKPLCFQEGKVAWAQSYLDKEGFSWNDCAFYSDSLNDLPLMEACAYPVAVHPGGPLSDLAAKRCWPVFRPQAP